MGMKLSMRSRMAFKPLAFDRYCANAIGSVLDACERELDYVMLFSLKAFLAVPTKA
jgi:hypothetical protein